MEKDENAFQLLHDDRTGSVVGKELSDMIKGLSSNNSIGDELVENPTEPDKNSCMKQKKDRKNSREWKADDKERHGGYSCITFRKRKVV